jgi:hypothetical protein
MALPSEYGDRSHIPVYLTAKIEGVVLPSWLAISLAASSIVAVLALLYLAAVCGQMGREIRILQLHAQDIENILIRSNLASRKDFPVWQSPTGKGTSADNSFPEDIPNDIKEK